jgi:hypothetical protein
MKNSILIIGESGVGKTHFGAQLLMRLQQNLGQLSMDGAATNLEPFTEAMDRLNEGITAEHTPLKTYVESVWPVKSKNGYRGQLIWPDYAGEQVSNIVISHNISNDWHQRIIESSSWIIIIRPHLYRLSADMLSKPFANNSELNFPAETGELSDQSRLIELLQIFLYLHSKSNPNSITPKVCFLISCWDELKVKTKPSEFFREHLPMLSEFIHSEWGKPLIMGLSALGKALDKEIKDNEYQTSGPDKFGYIVQVDGTHDPDLTLPIKYLIE